MTLNDIKDKIIYLTNLIHNKRIPIQPIKVSNTRSKKLRKRTPGKSPQKSDTNPNDTKISDRLRIENVYEIDGWIEEIGSGDTDGSFFPDEKTAFQVKQDFIKYAFNENAKGLRMSLHYEGEIIYGAVERFDITEEAMDKESTTAPRYSIKFIFVAIDNTI